MGRAELIELNELKQLLEDHQPILEDREKGLKSEVNQQIPELEHAIIGCIYAYNNSKKSVMEVVQIFGSDIIKKCVPLLSVGVMVKEGFLKLIEEIPEYSITMSDVEVDWMVSEFRELLHHIVHIAEQQKIMKELVDELNEVRRKNNAIKHALIPEIDEKIKEVEDKIEQEEVDGMIQLKFFEFA
jgi:vacuolar-type H+-ATPase subunit D/Vma8